MSNLSNVHLVSDGTNAGSRIEVDGVQMRGVVSAVWRLNSPDHATLWLKVAGATLDADLIDVVITKTSDEETR